MQNHCLNTIICVYSLCSFSFAVLSALYTLSETERFYCVTTYLTEELSKLRGFDKQ